MIGTIVKVSGSWGSGLLSLTIKLEPSGKTKLFYAENGPFIRAAEEAFGGVIQRGHTFSNRAIEGQRIDFEVDDIGVMTGFDVA